MRHRCTSLPLLCPAKICTMKIWKSFSTACTSLTIIHPWWFGRDGANLICSIVCEVSNASQKSIFCHLSDSLAIFLNFPMHYWSLPLGLGRWPLSCRFLCQINFQLLRVILREHGIRRGKGGLKMPCQVQVGFEVRQDCDIFDVSWVSNPIREFSWNF